MHGFAGSKYIILLENLFSRDANLVLLAAFQILRKTLEPWNGLEPFVYIHWKYPALTNSKYVRVKISNSNSNIYVRTALFACVQYYLCVYNVSYVRSMLFTLRCQISVPLMNFYNSPRYIFKKIVIYTAVLHR